MNPKFRKVYRLAAHDIGTQVQEIPTPNLLIKLQLGLISIDSLFSVVSSQSVERLFSLDYFLRADDFAVWTRGSLRPHVCLYIPRNHEYRGIVLPPVENPGLQSQLPLFVPACTRPILCGIRGAEPVCVCVCVRARGTSKFAQSLMCACPCP